MNREGRVIKKDRGYKIALLIAFFMLCIVPYGSASKSSLNYTKSEIFFDYACAYFDLGDFDDLGAFSPNTFSLYSKKEVKGQIFNGKTEFLVTKSTQKRVLDTTIPYEVDVCDDFKLNCTKVTLYNYTWKNITVRSDEWVKYDKYLPFYDAGYKNKKVQNVRYCSELRRKHTENGFEISADIVPKWDDVVYPQFAWWNASLNYNRVITNLNNYVDPFLVADGQLTLCNASSYCWDYFIWCNSSATKIYYKNNTGSTQTDLDIYCTQGDIRAVPMEIVGRVFNHGQANPWTRHTVVIHCDNSSFYDSSPNGHTPTKNSVPFIYNEAPVNKGCGFDGSDDRVGYGNVPEGTGALMSVHFWYRKDSGGDHNYPLGCATTGNPRWWPEHGASDVDFRLYDSGGTEAGGISKDVVPANDVWLHEVYVASDPANTHISYFNGKENTTEATALGDFESSHTFYIGGARTDLASNVSLDEIWIMNVTLNETVINFTYLNQVNYGFSVLGSESVPGDSTPPDINFITPTLNSSTINYTYTYINVTTSEDANCSLDWNGTNETASNATNRNFYVNKTSLSNGNYTYSMWCTDATRNLNESEERYIYINYTAPVFNSNLIIQANYCYNSDYMFIRQPTTADNGSIIFNEYLFLCQYGCNNNSWLNLGYPGCEESPLITYVLIVIGLIITAVMLNKWGEER